MKQSSMIKEILEEVAELKTEGEIIRYFRNNKLEGLLSDANFTEQLININPIVKEMLWNLGYEEFIFKEIEEKGLKIFIENEENLKFIPLKYKNEIFEIAQQEEASGEYAKAMKLYEVIKDRMGKDQVDKFNKKYGREDRKQETTYYKSKFSYYVCKLKSGQELTEEDVKEIENLVVEDKNNLLELKNPGQLTAEDIVKRFLSNGETISLAEVYEEYIKNTNNMTGENKGGGTGKNQYKAELQVPARIKRFNEMFNNPLVHQGTLKERGLIIMQPRDKAGNLLPIYVFERFLDKDGSEHYGGPATCIMHKVAKLKLDSIEQEEIQEAFQEGVREARTEFKKQRLLSSRRKTSENYYENIMSDIKEIMARYEEMQKTGEESLKEESETEETTKTNIAREESETEETTKTNIAREEPETGETTKTNIAREESEVDESAGASINEFEEIIRPERQEQIAPEGNDLGSLNAEELQKIIDENNKKIEQNEELLKQALIRKIMEQQRTIAAQQREIENLTTPKKEL